MAKKKVHTAEDALEIIRSLSSEEKERFWTAAEQLPEYQRWKARLHFRLLYVMTFEAQRNERFAKLLGLRTPLPSGEVMHELAEGLARDCVRLASPKKWKLDRDRMIRQWVDEGKSQAQIAKQLGMTAAAVAKANKRLPGYKPKGKKLDK